MNIGLIRHSLAFNIFRRSLIYINLLPLCLTSPRWQKNLVFSQKIRIFKQLQKNKGRGFTKVTNFYEVPILEYSFYNNLITTVYQAIPLAFDARRIELLF